MGTDVHVVCHDEGSSIVAVASVKFRSWMPPVPDWSFTAVASAPFEPGTEGAGES